MAHEQVELTHPELREKGMELANAISKLYSIKGEKKEAMNEFKQLIDKQENLISTLSLTVQTGKEVRSRTFFDDHIDDDE